jgi:hypothetical protein
MDDMEEHILDANERMGEALTEIGMNLGLPKPTPQYTWGAQQILVKIDELHAENERLRGRTHEIQAEEMRKRADLDKEIAYWRAMWQYAKQETEGMTADWAIPSTSSFWGMTSYANRATIMRIVGERNEAQAENERLRARINRFLRWCDEADRDLADAARAQRQPETREDGSPRYAALWTIQVRDALAAAPAPTEEAVEFDDEPEVPRRPDREQWQRTDEWYGGASLGEVERRTSWRRPRMGK